MPYILDIIVGIIIVICIIRGAKKGFIKAAFSILTFLLAAVLSFMFYVPFSDYIANTSVGQNVSQSLSASIYNAVSGENKADTETNTVSVQENNEKELGNTTEGIIKSLNLPTFMFSSVFEQSDFLMRTARLSAAQAVSNSLTGAFMKLVSGILLFLLIMIGLWILRRILEAIFKLPLLKEVNKLAGFVAGLINGVLLSYLLLAICVSLSGFGELSFIKNSIEGSFIYNYLCETNMITNMFLK